MKVPENQSRTLGSDSSATVKRRSDQSPNDLELMDLRFRRLYTHNATGRILRSNEPNSRPAPRFHLARTRLGNLWRMRHDLDSETIRDLSRLAGREGPVPASWVGDEPERPERLEPLRIVLRRSAEVTNEWCGPAYRFPAERLAAFAEQDSEVVCVSPNDEHLLERHFAGWISELAPRQPCFAILVDGQAVSICCSARPHDTVGSDPAAAAASLETAEPYRGRGYAARVVAAWAADLNRIGVIPLYSTSWTNRGSRAVAAKLGLVAYGEDLHLT